MKISVFTPTNNMEHILEAYRSLCDQTHKDWEWVILGNGKGWRDDKIIATLKADARVRVETFDKGTPKGIGHLKRMACELCLGDILLELDHDDWLIDTCLEKVYTAVLEGADFVYSDDVNFSPAEGVAATPKSDTFGEAYGWENYKFTYRGKEYDSSSSFEPCPRSLMYIGHAPNHVRAWTKEIYWSVGGHDPEMPVADDHDLVCRTYIAGGKFKFLKEVLYMYREHGNTYKAKREQIQALSYANAGKYLYPLVSRWCLNEGHRMIDLGGALGVKVRGWETLDIRPGADIQCDATNGLPFQDNSIGAFRAWDFLEHIPRENVVDFMNEVYRCLVPGGWLLSRTPSTDGRGAWQDPTHVSFWNSNSFWYYTGIDQAQYVPEIKARFQQARLTNDFPSPWHKQHNIVYTYSDMVALKGQRIPGGHNFGPGFKF